MKKVGNKEENLIHCLNLISDCRVSLNSELELQKSITLDFNVSFQDNSLVYDDDKEKELNQRQIILHSLIFYMYEERGMSYRKISKWLNRSGIKTHQGNTWGETGNSVYSVLKRMKEREKRVLEKRFKSESEIKNFKITHNQKNI